MTTRGRAIAALAALAGASLAAGCAVRPPAPARLACPYAPWYQHAYRHGAVPTLETQQRMRVWYASHAAGPASSLLSFGGGVDGIGVTSGTPRVYLVFYGSQWSSGGDPQAAAAYLQSLFTGIGTGGELWSGTMTQYCDGPLVAKGATACPGGGAPHVGYPRGGALAGVWFDTSAPAPASATPAQLAAEAVSAARHFANTSADSNRYTLYFIVSPSGTHPDGFGTTGGFCGWHDFTPSSFGDIAYANLPYVSDLGTSCGANFVNSGAAGVLDGFSIVGGHEYAEILTDQNPPGGWTNARTGGENGDECAWIAAGHGASANVSMGNGAYAMQSTWSNDSNACEISHAIR